MDRVKPEYTKPQIRDYGQLQQLTAANLHGADHRHPQGPPAPAVFS